MRAVRRDVTLVDGLITDAGRIAAEKGKPLGWYDVSTLKEPYRIEGKKTMAYELGEQLGWKFPDWIIYPTGGGTGMVGMWKAFEEMERIGWKCGTERPKMVSVQAEHCAPIVRAFEQGAERSEMWQNARTVADGLRVPEGDRRLPRAARHSRKRRHRDGRVATPTWSRHARAGLDGRHQRGAGGRRRAACAEGAAAAGRVKPSDTVVLFNTGGALKYLDVLSAASPAEALAKAGQSPSEIPIARAVRTTSKSSGTLRVRPTTFSSGTATMSGG